MRYQYWGSFLSTLILLSLIHSQFFVLSSYFPESCCAPHSWPFLCFPPLSLHWYTGLSKRKIPMNPYKMHVSTYIGAPPQPRCSSNVLYPTLYVQKKTSLNGGCSLCIVHVNLQLCVYRNKACFKKCVVQQEVGLIGLFKHIWHGCIHRLQ